MGLKPSNATHYLHDPQEVLGIVEGILNTLCDIEPQSIQPTVMIWSVMVLLSYDSMYHVSNLSELFAHDDLNLFAEQLWCNMFNQQI